MSHTPGPWKVRYFGLTQDGDPYHFIEAGDDGFVGKRWMNVSGCIGEEDARLIAAAPDMLEALEGAERLLTWMESGHLHKEPDPQPIREQVQEAIAKAKGAA